MAHFKRLGQAYANLREENYYHYPLDVSQSSRIDDHKNLYAPAPVLHRPPVKTGNYANQWTTTYSVGEDRVILNENAPSEQDMINLFEHSKNIDLWTSSRPNGQALKPSSNDETSFTIPEEVEQKPLRRFNCCCCCSLFIFYLVSAFCITLLILHLYYPDELRVFGVHPKTEKMNAIVTRNKEDIEAIMNLLETFCLTWVNTDRLLVECEQVLGKKLFKPN